ncbi:unnamed protein product [Toxocara canis]|uniref:MFS domain-containing protein n=1 Tax=Toxocara canis TaxID=6265 RepID=A0A183UWQ0_TOXCA|nr:unnamed protein product [Toxocara canis]
MLKEALSNTFGEDRSTSECSKPLVRDMVQAKPVIKTVEAFEHGETPWRSIWLSYIVQMLTGIQFSIYFTSMWPYLTTLDPNADLAFFGWITSAYSIGQMVSTWGFGYWNQKTMSARHPACCGLFFMAIGNILYALLPNLPNNHRWFMLVARLLVGFGSGSLIVLRTYCAMSSLKKDRTKVMSLAVGSWVLGLSLGPAVQAMFAPIGKNGVKIAALQLNMYTSPALLMVLISAISILFLVLCFTETYAGVATNEHGERGAFTVIPKYDHIAAYACIYLWFMLQTVATNVEVIATPFTISLYNWNDETAVFYNGIIQFFSCCINVINYILISSTFIGRIDKRKLLIFSCSCFIAYHLLTSPWPFYGGPLDYIKMGKLSKKLMAVMFLLLTISMTLCSELIADCMKTRYEWCAYTTRVPLIVYIFSFIVILGFAFPFTSAPLGTLFSEILGPRKQGIMQGFFEFGACIARCVAPLVLT